MKRSLLVLILFFSLNVFAQIPTNGLIACYPFNGNADDYSGNNNLGMIYWRGISYN
jgi:hypothetical protein